VQHKEIEPIYVPTDLQPADMMTKGLTSEKFTIFRDMVMGEPSKQNHFNPKPIITHSVVRDNSPPATTLIVTKGPSNSERTNHKMPQTI
jgi:hypothetical protein